MCKEFKRSERGEEEKRTWQMGKECRLKNRHNYLWICFSQEYKHLSNKRSVLRVKKYRVRPGREVLVKD